MLQPSKARQPNKDLLSSPFSLLAGVCGATYVPLRAAQFAHRVLPGGLSQPSEVKGDGFLQCGRQNVSSARSTLMEIKSIVDSRPDRSPSPPASNNKWQPSPTSPVLARHAKRCPDVKHQLSPARTCCQPRLGSCHCEARISSVE